MSEAILLMMHRAQERERGERRDATENRLRILATAERLFAEQGVAAVTMADIASAARVGKGTLYRRFCNKGELCLSLMDSQLRDFQEKQLAAMRQMGERGEPILEQLSQFLESLATFTATHMPLLFEVQQHDLTLPEAEVERPHFWQYMTVRALLQRAEGRGEIRPGMDTDYLAEALLAPLSPQTFRFQMENLGFTPERVGIGLRMLVSGLSWPEGKV